MKKTLSLTLMTLLLCVCMVFGLTACGGFTQDDIDNAVNESTAPLNEQITALEADIAEKETKIATLEGEKTALTTEKAELEAEIEEIEAEVTALETEKATLEAEVTALEEEKATLTTDNATLESSIADKNATIEDLNTAITDLNTDKANLTARVTELEESIAKKNTAIADLNSIIDTLEDEKQTLTEKNARLEGENEQLKGENEQLKGENEQLEAENEQLKGENEQLEIRLNCFEGKHVIDTENEISYAWSKDYSTCTASGVCVYCDGEATEVTNGVVGDNKITATFENSALEAQLVHTVTTYDELNTLLQSGEAVNIRLDATLENIQYLNCLYGTTAVLDMNGNDITFETRCWLYVDGASLTLKGEGTITASDLWTINCRGTLSIEDNVTVNGDGYAILLEGYPYANATVNISGGTINAQDNGVNFYFNNEYTSLTITGGTFSCDSTEYVDTEKYAVTDNGNGAYTVSCNHKNSAHTAFYDIGNGTHGFICTVCGKFGSEKHTAVYVENDGSTHFVDCTICDSKITEKHSYDDNDECACGAKIPVVTTAEELLKAVEKGGNIKLGNDIEVSSDDGSYPLKIYADVSIDLNGKTLSSTSGSIIYISDESTVSIFNGALVSNGTGITNFGTLSIDNCTITRYVSLNNRSGTTTVTNSTLNGLVYSYGGTITLYDSVTLGANTNGKIGLASFGGSIVSYFDPSDMLYGESVVTDNDDGTWTITAAE